MKYHFSILLVSLFLLSGIVSADISIMEEKHSETKTFDYIYARGDPFELYLNETPYQNGNASVWLFGPGTIVFDKRMLVENGITRVHLAENETESWEPGEYTLIAQWYGENKVQEVFFEIGNEVSYLQSPWKKVNALDIGKNGTRYDPYTFKGFLEKMINNTQYSDDNLTEYRIKVESPQVVITDYMEYEVGILGFDGYTNVREGSTLTFIWDDERNVLSQDKAEHTYLTKAEGNLNGYRRFHILIPVKYQYESPGMHFVTAISPYGEKTVASVYVYEVWENTPRRNETIRFVGRDPFLKVINETPQPSTTVIVTEKVPVAVNILPEPTASPTPEPFEEAPQFDLVKWIRELFGYAKDK